MSCKYSTKITDSKFRNVTGERDSLTLKNKTKKPLTSVQEGKTVRIIDSAQTKLPNLSLVEFFLFLSIPPPALFIKVTEINI